MPVERDPGQGSYPPSLPKLSIAERLRWCLIGEDDLARVRRLAELSGEMVGPVVDAFYEHTLTFDGMRSLFPSDAAIEQEKANHRRYFERLMRGVVDQAYLADRVEVGETNERVGLGPDWYLGAFDFYLEAVANRLLERSGEHAAEAFGLFLSLLKVAHLDMALTLDSFIMAREATTALRQKEMSELPTPVLQLREGLLLIPVVGMVDSYRAQALTEQLLQAIKEERARIVVLDVTGVAVVDTAVANHLTHTVLAARLMGASSIITGISAQVAEALVRIGLDSRELTTRCDLRSGLELAEAMLARAVG
jgi:rsbT co-antagonist protein RsbR